MGKPVYRSPLSEAHRRLNFAITHHLRREQKFEAQQEASRQNIEVLRGVCEGLRSGNNAAEPEA